MRVIARRALREFWERHPDAESALRDWYTEVTHAVWTSTADIKSHYRTASVVTASRVVFNIRGNRYRLVARVNFVRQVVFVRFLGTHSEYDRIDVESI